MPCRCCCCRSCQEPQLELSYQEQEEAEDRRRQQPQRAPSTTSVRSWRSRFSLSSRLSRGSDLPPPYEEGSAREAQPQVPAVQKTPVPYTIPLASFLDDNALLNTIAKVHAADFSEYGISQEQFLTFYYELDKRLSHQAEDQSGMLNNVMTILRDSSTTSTGDTMPRIDNFVELSNQDLFHPAHLHVDVFGSDAVKHKVISSPALELDRAKTMAKLSKIEEKLAKLSYKLNRDLPNTESEREAQQVEAEYAEKKAKLRHKANEVLAAFNQKTDAAYGQMMPGSLNQDGPLWLVVSERRDAWETAET